jgi:hypothetical protein
MDMPSFDLSVNILTLLALIACPALLGFILRSSQLARKNRKIAALEKELMAAYAETLELEKEHSELVSSMKDPSIPVIAMKHTGKEENTSSSSPDSAVRKDKMPPRTAG